VCIHLLAVNRQSLTIEEAIPCDDTSSSAQQEHLIEWSGDENQNQNQEREHEHVKPYLSSTRFSHQSDNFPGATNPETSSSNNRRSPETEPAKKRASKKCVSMS
jgi:hypothetical protein